MATTFDLTFDATFGELLLSGTTPTVTGCRRKGVCLHWLTLDGGWMSWLFEGKVTDDKGVDSRGSFRQGGLTQYSQKESAKLLTIRTADLTREQADAVATVYESIAVHILMHDDADQVHDFPVSIEPGQFAIWKTGQSRGQLEVRIILPSVRSQRA